MKSTRSSRLRSLLLPAPPWQKAYATVAVGILIAASNAAAAVISFTGNYSQSFDTLPDTTPDPSTALDVVGSGGPIHLGGATGYGGTAMDGWYFGRDAGSNADALFRVGPGTATGGATYSFGTDGQSDRALGTMASGAQTPYFGMLMRNDTGGVLNTIDISFTGEQWRRGNGAANALRFRYADGATSVTDAVTEDENFIFISPITSGTSLALDGNLAANQVLISGTLLNLDWQPGELLAIRWTDFDNSGFDDALAIDNLTVVPEPGTAGLVAAALIGAALMRRRRMQDAEEKCGG
jgi:hypothetical protein